MEKEDTKYLDICACIPNWLRQPIRKCVYCYENVVTFIKFCVMIPCAVNNHNTHLIPLVFHSACFDLWKEKLSGTIRGRLIDAYPNVQSNISNYSVKVMSERCLNRHVLTGIYCRHCHVGEQVRCHFYRCSKCRSVAYCSHECQKNDWADHKQECSKRPKQNTLELKFYNEDTGVLCDYMSKRDKEILQRSFTNLCNNLSCGRLLKQPIARTFIRTPCSCFKQEHTFPVAFCGISCQRKCLS